MHSKPTTTFASLPYELQEMLPLYLTPNELTICARVNQAWYSVFHHHIWQHLDSLPRRGFGYWKYIFSGYCGWEGLTNNAHLVQAMTIHFDGEDRLYLDCNQEENDRVFEFSQDGRDVFFPRLRAGRFLGLKRRGGLVDGLLKMGSAIGWKELTLEMFDELDGEDEYGNVDRSILHADRMFKAILAQASTLEVLKLDGAGYFTSKDINHLLCSAPNLRVLQLLGDRARTWARQEPCLDAKDAAQSEWVCSNLEIFGCGIGGIPRPDIVRRIGGNTASSYTVQGTYDDSIDLQRGVYMQLGRLAELKELYLGSPLEKYEEEVDEAQVDEPERKDSPLRQFDCLAMTLDSGLDLLKSLKNLHTVELRDMEVYIGKPLEQKWVAENWSKVKKVSFI
ncbi:MAG: hypothetical protein J3R72DRAFT_484603 [Linnemannia gamsii]|nr:MAG: hypothetical protein J3R72DRAFT_484603 [Linnemannia gamsii]